MARVVTVEVGGSSVQSAVFADGHDVTFFDAPVALSDDDLWALAAPGLVVDGRVQGAHHLGWMDAEAWQLLGYDRRPDVSANDAVAAGLGEAVLRDRFDDLLYVGLGTGVGSAVVRSGIAVDSALGHLQGFSSLRCGGCHGVGCLDASIGGHALPTPLQPHDMRRLVRLLAAAISQQHPDVTLVVLGGGLQRHYPTIASELNAALPAMDVQPTAAPAEAKSAAPWGLLHLLGRVG